MPTLITALKRKSIATAVVIGMAANATAADFIRPQAAYEQPPETVAYDNGGLVSKTQIDKLAATSAEIGELLQVREGLWQLPLSPFSYVTIIEGETGFIVMDTGDDIHEGELVLEKIASISDKPVVALLYSHSHYTFGAQPFLDRNSELPVIGHPQVNSNVLESGGAGAAIPELSPVLLARTAEQFSFLLPDEGADAKAPTPMGKEKGFVAVNTPVENGQRMVVDGIEMVFYTEFDSDTNDQTMVWMPETKTMLHNHLWPVFPNFYSLRGSLYRDPRDWANGIRHMRDMEPEYLLGTNLKPLVGKAEINKALSGYFDAITYLYDQTLRGIMHGQTPEELRHTVQLPTELAEQPHNNLGYGEFSYYPPYIYNYALGWFGRDTENLNRIAPQLQAEKIVEGFGGVEAVKKELQKVIANQEYAWAGELGGYLVKVAPQDVEARQLLADVMRTMGQQTEASIPRSFYLSKALELEGKAHIPSLLYTGPEQVLASPAETSVDYYRVRLDPSVSVGQNVQLSITLSDTDAPTMGLHVRGGVAEFINDVTQYSHASDASITMPKAVWADYYVGRLSLQDLITHAQVKVSDEAQVQGFFSLFDQMHESGAALIAPSSFIN